MRKLLTLACSIVTGIVYGQGTYIPNGTSSIHLIDRYEIKSGRLATPQEFNTTIRGYQRNRIANYIDSFEVSGANLGKVDYFNLSYLQADNFEFSHAESSKSSRHYKNLYLYKAATYAVKTPEFKLVLNPVTLLQQGYDTRTGRRASINNRGVELRGAIGSKLGFYTTFSDEILVPNSWVYEFYRDNLAIPGAGFWKRDDNDSIPDALNYSTAFGYIVYQPNKHFDIQFGHGNHFLGNGYRTFYQSDFSRNHLSLRVNTRIWKINYTNIWGEIFDWVPPTQRYLPKRHYYATTYANVNVTKNLNIGLFQTVSFQRDSGYASTAYDPQYLNPIIFYKPVENGLNSPDKTILGTDFKWNFLRHFQLYGQAVISEFKINELLADSGWFGNKWATQLGLKYIDVAGINNLDLQLEMNIARPYMYTSFDAKNAYVNYNQNMAHPLGANFYEYIGIIRCQPIERLTMKATAIYAIYGNDTNGSNWGKNIRIAYGPNSLPRQYGNYITQGVKTTLLFTDLVLSYMLKHNFFVDLQVTYRNTSSELKQFETSAWFVGASVRWNFAERRWDF